MAEAAHVEVRGLPQLARGTAVLADRIEDGARAAFLRAADQAATLVRGRVPRRSGRLAASVRADQLDDGASVGMGGSGVPYAGWIEFGGTRGRPYMPGGRYLVPVTEEAGPLLRTAGEAAARDEIRRMTWPAVPLT